MSHSTGLVTLTKELCLAQLGRILATWCSPGEKLQDPLEKGGFYIFCRKNHFRRYGQTYLSNRTSVCSFWLCQNCWIENLSAEVSFKSLTSIKYSLCRCYQ